MIPIAGLNRFTVFSALALLTQNVFAVATYDFSANVSTEVTGLLDANENSVEMENWFSFISTSFGFVATSTGDADPSPPNSEGDNLVFNTGEYSWEIEAEATGTASALGFASSNALGGLLVTITNNTDDVITLMLSNDVGALGAYALNSGIEKLIAGSSNAIISEAVTNSTIVNGSINLGSNIIGPDSDSASNLASTIGFERVINPGSDYTFELLAEAEGGVEVVPVPPTSLLIGLGFAVLGYRRFKSA
ncbi:MAG: hypothetical protein PVF91_01120 [Chromatiales bacterium]|jgi:hypothetical protein